MGSPSKCLKDDCQRDAVWSGYCMVCYKKKKSEETKNSFLGNKTNEELLNIIETSTEKGPKMDDAHRFLVAFNLKPGNYKISSKLLFSMYNNWSANPTSKLDFFNKLSGFFKKGDTANLTAGYFMELDPFTKMIEDGNALISGKTIYAKEEKTNKKRQSKVSNARKKVQQQD